jgi:hypothetical protein
MRSAAATNPSDFFPARSAGVCLLRGHVDEVRYSGDSAYCLAVRIPLETIRARD